MSKTPHVCPFCGASLSILASDPPPPNDRMHTSMACEQCVIADDQTPHACGNTNSGTRIDERLLQERQ